MKFYRKQPIEAEQFDGSDEMVDKYELIDAGTMLGTHHSPELYLTGSGKLDVGDWIATGVNGEHWPIADDVFKKMYAELPVIPKNVDEYIRWCQGEGGVGNVSDAMDYAHGDVASWIYDERNSDTFARAWLDGFQVEEDK